jgi:hypothetical protein
VVEVEVAAELSLRLKLVVEEVVEALDLMVVLQTEHLRLVVVDFPVLAPAVQVVVEALMVAPEPLVTLRFRAVLAAQEVIML